MSLTPYVPAIITITRDITERKQMEDELKRSREQYAPVVNNLREVVFQTDTKGRWTFLNPAWTEITGFDTKESLGTSFLSYIHPDDREKAQILLRPLMESREEYCRNEIRYVTKDVGVRWIEFIAIVIFDASGKVMGTSGTLNDVTERKQVEEALKEERDFINTVIETVESLIVVLDPDCCIVSFNRACEKLTGLSSPGSDRKVRQVAERIRTALEALQIPHSRSTVSEVVTISLGVSTMIPNVFSTN